MRLIIGNMIFSTWSLRPWLVLRKAGLDPELVEIFRDQRARFGASGPYLFGDWSIADAFFTPVAARIRHFQIDLAAHGDDGTAAAYCATLLADPLVQEWKARAGVA